MNDPRILLNDPNTTAAQLAEIAGSHPELAAQIAQHPNAYPALREWAGQQVARTQAAAQQAAAQQAATAQPAQPAYPQQPSMPAQPAAPGQAAQPGYPQQPAQPQFQGQPAQPGYPQQQPTQPQFATQPGAQYGQPGAAPAGYGQQPGFTQGYGSAAEPKKKKTGLIVGIAAGAVLVIAGGTIGAVALSGGFGASGGASSPQGAVTNLFNSAKSADVMGSLGAFAPSEAALFADTFAELAKMKGEGDGRSYDEISKDLQDAMQIEISDVAMDEEEIADEVVRVTLTDWSITIDGDEEKLADLATELTEAQMRDQYLQFGYTESEIDEMFEMQRDAMIEQMDFPQTVTAADFREQSGSDLSVVSVKEDGQWYVSALMTAADVAYQQQMKWDDSLPDLGEKVLEPTKFDSPEAAAIGLTEAISSSDLTEITKALSLPERRVLSIYGPLIEGNLTGGAPTFDPTDFSSEIVDGKGRITIDELGIEGVGSIEGLCYTDEYWGDTQCLTDIPVLNKLGIEDVDLIAVQESGGWVIAPLGTLGDATSILAKNFVEYYNEGKLDELMSGF